MEMRRRGTPVGLSLLWPRSSEEHLGMWPDHHLGSWGAGGSAQVTFNNLPVCHLSPGSNKNGIGLGVVCTDIVYGVTIAVEEALCSDSTHFFIAVTSFMFGILTHLAKTV